MISVLISSESRYPIGQKKIREQVSKWLVKEGLEDVEISILVVGSRKIRQLNREYRKNDEPTDVLAFPQEGPRGPDGILRLGDIVICYPAAREEAREEEKLVDEKILELIEHGLNHLLGKEK